MRALNSSETETYFVLDTRNAAGATYHALYTQLAPVRLICSRAHNNLLQGSRAEDLETSQTSDGRRICPNAVVPTDLGDTDAESSAETGDMRRCLSGSHA
ncbi:hypothetical protein AcW1_007955 [Taiwanofungus camphoratus]|nr:hypothetical protein AcW1_007955 [Antrodia cinnamomea]KAI0955630.1 hypothetical protein AcV7_006244 [Antrodia cinnamomea]